MNFIWFLYLILPSTAEPAGTKLKTSLRSLSLTGDDGLSEGHKALNMIRRPNVGLKLGQCRRPWACVTDIVYITLHVFVFIVPL